MPNPYLCPLSKKPPRFPVLTNAGITYDLVFIAQKMLQKAVSDASLDPTEKVAINALTYDRTIQRLNEESTGEKIVLSQEEKNDIIMYCVELRVRYSELDIRGIISLEGFQVLQRDIHHYRDSFCWAAERGDTDYIRMLLTHPSISPNNSRSKGMTPLFSAVYKGDLEIVTLLLADKRVDPTLETSRGFFPLLIATQHGRINIVRALLRDPRVDPNQAGHRNTTPLCKAVEKGHVDVINLLLSDPRVDLNQAGGNGATPLLIAAESGRANIVKMLLGDQRIKPDLITEADARTPLCMAAWMGHTEVVMALLEDKRIDPNQARPDGSTLLILAADQGHTGVVSALLADPRIVPDQTMRATVTALFMAVQSNRTEVITVLLADGRVNPNQIINEHGETLLIMAIGKGFLDSVRALLANSRVNSNHIMNDGTTALYEAALFAQFDMVRSLLPLQTGITETDPLITSVVEGYSTWIRTLLSYEHIQDYYLKQMILKPRLMQQVLISNPTFLDALAEHADALWVRLRDQPAHFGLSRDAHHSLLETVLESELLSNKRLDHPLYTLFNEPRSCCYGFFGCSRTILSKIRLFLNERNDHQAVVGAAL